MPALHTTIVLGFLTFVWLVVRPQLFLVSRWRRLAFDPGIVLVSALLVSPAGIERLMILLPQLSWAVLGSYVVASSGVSAVIIVELLRSVFTRSRNWSDHIHVRIIVASWLLLLVAQVLFLAIARSRLHRAAGEH
jgi:hypothetical protein